MTLRAVWVETEAQMEWALRRREGKKWSSKYGQVFQEVFLGRRVEMGEAF